MNRRFFLVFLALVLSAATAVPAFAQAAAANRAAIEKSIAASERALNEAFAKGDLKAFHANVAPDAVDLEGNGMNKVNTPDFDKMIQSAKIQSWNIDGSQFLWVSDTAVVHMYRWTGKGTVDGQPIPTPTWASTLWTNKGGKWMAMFHQETQAIPAPPPPGAKK